MAALPRGGRHVRCLIGRWRHDGAVSFVFDPFVHGFMQRGLVVAVLVGTVCALLSCYLVLKGWSLMGDAVSHAVLPGIVLAQISPFRR
jgi:ABC-type Mn2+/Zn2+ transport system permease subunit